MPRDGASQRRDHSSPLLSKKSVESIPTREAQKLYFTTTHSVDFSYKPVKPEDSTESFEDVLQIGQRDTKYLRMPAIPTNLPSYDSVLYRRDFDWKPNVDLIENREFVKTLKPHHQPAPNLAPEKNSLYARDFQKPSLRRKVQREPPIEDGSARILGGTGNWMASSSNAQEHFRTPGQIFKDKPFGLVTNLEVMGASAKSWESNYKKNFAPAEGAPPLARRPRPGRVAPQDVAQMMGEFKREMRRSSSAPAGGQSILQRPF
mmetsp:Transcript_5956/g.14141  ORF Transcript_5956/g.14141 Transcript_5956/m.14141 type:complete len:261 (+) Transcript_5956:47-829(+)|eukprot:CAMPEP_0171065958 /NCGR_PEP_ID=MMETSP0766_2-20121228/7146_1 /TAXON_ID=439317 /ORGANISM="Gambierdiscus australes, Strain CAWD 149" /LENGTH=260 /DNA_ID=CAMNT_0011522101 /DNA_START=46 /DNA_END=828 /DNA_ORIENTATION=+